MKTAVKNGRIRNYFECCVIKNQVEWKSVRRESEIEGRGGVEIRCNSDHLHKTRKRRILAEEPHF